MSKPMFQHRHYVAIAQVVARLAQHTDESRKIDHAAFGRELAELFLRDNPRFDVGRFEAACEGKPINGRDK